MVRNSSLRRRASGSATLRAAALAVAIVVAPLAMPQGNPFFGGDVSTPWAAFKLNPKTRLKLDYRNANIDAIIAMYQRASGVTIVKDPSLTGPLTVSSAKAVPLSDAFQILSTTLSLKGYDMRKEGNLLVIRKRDNNPRGGGPGPIGIAPTDPNGDGRPDFTENQPVLTVYPINFANASQIARIINEVFADSGNTNFGGFRFGENQGGPQVEAAVQGFQRGGFQRGGGQQNGRFPGGFNPFNRGGATTLVKASSDDYSNQVIVSAPQRFQSQVSSIIKQLDKVTDTPVQTKVYHLDYASATDAAPVIQSVLNANVPRGRGGATTTQSQGPGAFFNALRGQQTGSGTVTADSRTNNVVVTATPENIKTVDQVVKELDLNVPVESTTFVFQLNNARADDVATLLQNAFGTRTGVNGARTNSNINNRAGTNTRTNNNNNNRNTGTPRLGAQVQGNDLDLALADPNSPSGELATSVGVTQGFGQNFFGQNRGSQTTTNPTGRNASGQVVNTRDLSNQVTAIADPNTNSIIVVTSPENAAIIRSILDQLDRIPEQVLIETVIVEASLTAADKLGVEWSYTGGGKNQSTITNNFGNVGADATAAQQEGFQYTLTGTNYSVFLNALKSDNKFQVLSTPKIFTSNNVQAEINISQSLPYITSSIQNVNGTFTNNYQFTDVGIVLTVTPRITSNGMVAMDVEQTANDLQGYTSFNAPIINQRIANTQVSVKDGETIILGGIIRNTINSDVRKIPVLGDIPLLGNLFKSTQKTKEKTELLVFLTPRIVRDPDEAHRLREDIERKMSPETQKSVTDYLQKGNNDKKTATPPGTGTTNTPVRKPGGN
jgi:general secretion pathway protein D